MRIDIDGIIAAAVFLDRGEEDLCRWELELEMLSFGIGEEDPEGIARRCNALETLRSHSGALLDVTATVSDHVDARRADDLHPELRPTVDRQAVKAHEIDRRMVQLRRRMLDLGMLLGEALRAFQDETIDETVARVVGGLGGPGTLEEIERAMAVDGAGRRSAVEAWRLLQGDVRQGKIVEGAAPAVLKETLARLTTSGVARRRTGLLQTTTTWVVDRSNAPSRMTRVEPPMWSQDGVVAHDGIRSLLRTA